MHVALFYTDVVGIWASVRWRLWKVLRIRGFSVSAFFLGNIALDLLEVISVPGCFGIVDIDSFISKLLKLSDLVRRRHWGFQSLMLREFMGGHMVSQQ